MVRLSSTPSRPDASTAPRARDAALGLTGRLARTGALHPWRVLAAWVVLMALAIVPAGTIGDVLVQENGAGANIEAQTAQDLVARARTALGQEPVPTEYVLVMGEDGARVTDPGVQDLVADLAATLRTTDGVTAVVAPTDGAPGMVSQDGTVALVQAQMVSGDPEDADSLVEAVQAADGATDGVRVVTVGEGSINAEFSRLADETLGRAELVGVPIALIVLILVFGAVVAALLPLGLGLVSILVATALAALVGRLTELDMFIANMITMIGLAVGIDYSLFIVQRYREERQAGRETVDAVVAAGATATRAVAFSGATVIIALLGLMIIPQTTMRSLGLGAILAVLATLLAALTLLPALLGLLGDRVNRLRVPGMHRDTDTRHVFWRRITRIVTARPVVSVVLAAGLLLGAAVPYLDIRIGSNFIEALPEDSDGRLGFELLSEKFQGGVVTAPIAIESDDVTSPAVTEATATLVAALEADPAYADVVAMPVPDEGLVVVQSNALLDPSTDQAQDAVRRLRDEIVPAAFDGTGATVYVGGDAAFVTDFVDLVNGRTPAVFAFVLTLSFLLLLVAFRSVVVPLKAIVMNLLSVGAAYGMIVLVFQHGVGAGVLGFQQTDVIEAWVPLFMFAVLFGLSMDYHVFLLSRIKEHYVATGDNAASVEHGLSVTGAIITGAALIMVAVFGGFAAGSLVMFQQMGFGLAVAVALDATIVRSVLVPSAMELLGDANWWFPSWLGWLPHLSVEGPPLPPAAPTVITLPEVTPQVPSR